MFKKLKRRKRLAKLRELRAWRDNALKLTNGGLIETTINERPQVSRVYTFDGDYNKSWEVKLTSGWAIELIDKLSATQIVMERKELPKSAYLELGLLMVRRVYQELSSNLRTGKY
jgi:hypothetical protein